VKGPYIFAYSDSKISRIDDANSTFGVHASKGVIGTNIDYAAGAEGLKVGLVMILVWVACL
jgi:hypothetical protein